MCGVCTYNFIGASLLSVTGKQAANLYASVYHLVWAQRQGVQGIVIRIIFVGVRKERCIWGGAN